MPKLETIASNQIMLNAQRMVSITAEISSDSASNALPDSPFSCTDELKGTMPITRSMPMFAAIFSVVAPSALLMMKYL
jgi:hypothetical protein